MKKKKLKKNVKNTMYYVMMCILLGVFCFSAVQMFKELKSYQDDQNAYDELNQFVEVPVEQENEEIPETERIPQIDFESLMEINDDCIGWIYVPGTKISYPVVQTTNNDYYLKRLFNKTYGISGTVFLDARNDAEMTDRHMILYGHHMKNGTMFANAEDYKDQLYADEHPTGMYITPEKVYDILFFAGYLTDAYNDSWTLNFTDAEFEDWISKSKSRSHFYSDVTPEIGDQIITLSTCSYDIADGRFVLLGILKEKTKD